MPLEFPDAFEGAINQLKNLPLIAHPTQWDEKVGSYNLFATSILSNTYEEDGKRTPQSIAITQSKKKRNTLATCKTIEQLRQHAMPPSPSDEKNKPHFPLDLTFIHTYFYYGEKGKIAKLGMCDLWQYIYPKTRKDSHPPIIDLKDWYAQLALAVHALHACDLVHRDIKCENIFLFPDTKGNTKLKLGDLDGVTPATSHSKIIATPSQLPPEVCSYWVPFSPDNKICSAKYHIANKKALDCYALGVTFHTMFFKLKYKLSREQKSQIFKLIKALLDHSPFHRLTIEQVLQHPFFGSTAEKRDHYFKTIKKKYSSKEVYIDGYYLPPNNPLPEKNDAFIILPEALKNILTTATELNIQIHSLKAIPDAKHLRVDFVEIHGYFVNEATLLTLQKKASHLKNQLDNFIQKKPLSTLCNPLNCILSDLSKYSSDILSVIHALLIAYPTTALSTDKLIDTFRRALAQFRRINTSYQTEQTKTCYHLFGWKIENTMISKEEKAANQLLKTLESQRRTQSPRAVFQLILSYLTETKNDHIHSFKSILLNELETISKQPLIKWLDQLSHVAPEKEEKHAKRQQLSPPS